MFPPALHHLGQVHENSLLKVTFDQITDGQLKFAELEPHVDTVVIGKGQDARKYTIYSGKRNMEAHLKKQFPNDANAVEELFKITKVVYLLPYCNFWLFVHAHLCKSFCF